MFHVEVSYVKLIEPVSKTFTESFETVELDRKACLAHVERLELL